jgi:hypothetical protein
MKRFVSYSLLGAILALTFWLTSTRSPVPPAALAPNRSGSPLVATTTPRARPSLTPPNPGPTAVPVPAIVHPSATINGPPAFREFSAWAERFLSGDPGATIARGTALAWKRREAMLELIQTDPEKALAMSVPFHWRTVLPAGVTQYFEEQVDGRGAFLVAIATDFDRGKAEVFRRVEMGEKHYQAFVYGRRARQSTQARIPLHGVALGDKLALSADPIRALEADEAASFAEAVRRPARNVCGVCGQPSGPGSRTLYADIGGDVACFCGAAHAELVAQTWVAAESGGSNGGVASRAISASEDSWTHGPKTLLYMRLNFPDNLIEPISEANAYAVMDNVNAFYVDGSYDMTSLTAIVTPMLTLPQTKAWYSTAGPFALLTDAHLVARQAGFDTANFDLEIACFTSVPGFNWGGLGMVGGKGAWLQSSGPGVTAHELGHNYGLWHANFWDTTANSSMIGPGESLEYGNPYDTMGQAAAGVYQFNAEFKNSLGWLPDTAVYSVTSNGVYVLSPFDLPNRVYGLMYAAQIRKDFDRSYWLEFRQRFPNATLQNGLLLNWSPWAASNGGTDLIDTTPGTPGGLADAALVVGRTFSDTAAGVHLTPVARTCGTDGVCVLAVQINLGAFLGNQPPLLSLESERTHAALGQLVHFHAAATDPDNDTLAYGWSFDDGTFSTDNQAFTSRSWNTPGEHVVRCVVSDMKGGVASANSIVTVGAPSGFRITGVILDTNGIPVEGVRVDNNPTNASSYIGGYTDSDGRYVITGVSGEISLYAAKYGFVFTNITWSNPIVADSNILSADFVATPLTTLNIEASTNTVPENGTNVVLFTLHRTGDLSTNLTATLVLSGTARPGSDFTLQPKLVTGTNSVEFPPGAGTVSFTLRPINDTLVEGPETVTLTLLDDGINVIGSLGEATMTILDDDNQVPPAVSVVATTPSVPENGMDSGEFAFTRTGSTQADLPVYYSVSGTATPGSDYSMLLGVVVIPAGQSTALVRFQPIDDKDVEPDETVIVSLLPNPGYTVSGGAPQITIVDDDLATVTIFPTDDGAAEPSTPGQFTVKRDGDLSANLVVHYAVTGTATSGLDFVPLSGSVTIPAGATSTNILLVPLDDTLLEGDESVTLTLTNSPYCSVGTPGSATLYIRDRQRPAVTISAIDASASEPGDDFGAFRISRGSVVNGPLTVYFAISGTAINGVDYVPLDNTVVIPDGTNSVTVEVIPFDDLHLEPTEDVILTLLPSTNYNVGFPNQAKVEILDDDPNCVPAVGFTFSASSAPESQSPGVSLSLSYPSTSAVTVNYRVIGGTASSNDFTLSPGPITFNPGEMAKSIPLQIKDNSLFEPNRTIRLALYDPINATLDGFKVHTYTILDDDAATLTVTTNGPTASETGPTAGSFRISRVGRTNADQVVNFEMTGTASAPTDYAPLGTSTVILAGKTFVDLPVRPVDDRTVEHGETVVLTLTSAPGATIASPNAATISISDNDPNSLPVVTVTATTAAIEGGTSGQFTFSRTTTNGALTVYFSIAGTAVNGADYLAISNSVTIPNGQATATLPIIPFDDSLIEGDETVILTLTVDDTYRAADPASAMLLLHDNDQVVSVDATDFIASEPGTDKGQFVFTRIGSTVSDVRVFFDISGTASNGVDYVPISNSLVIPAGALRAFLDIVPLDDTLIEGPETVTLTLRPDSAYSLGTPANATVTILDDEPMLTITATVSNVVEGSQQPAVFTLIRTGNPKYNVTAHLAVGGTAEYGVDYPPILTNVFFSCGVTSIDLLVLPTNELAIEGPETVTVQLLPDPAYTILSPSNALITIEDAGTNLAPTVTITSPTAPFVFLPGTNANMILEATVSDDSTNPPALIWSKVAGPDTFAFGSNQLANTTASFTNVGVYVLRLTADDGALQSYAEVTVSVGATNLLSTNLLHWSLNDGSGTNVLDSSGAGRNGVLVGSPTWTTNGVLGGALSFSGSNDWVRAVGDTNFLNGLKGFSLSLWLKATATNSDRGIFSANDSTANSTLSLCVRSSASCGPSSNVIEATLTASRGSVRRISAPNVLTNGWQHLLLTWSNGLAPSLFINGRLDQPLAHFAAVSGFLTNCPQFILGKGPADCPASWQGQLDDVRLFPRALTPPEIASLAALPPTNYGAIVDAGSNMTLQVTASATLAGTVSDDGRPVPPGTLINTWIQADGPGTVLFTNSHSLTNSIRFSDPGEYLLRLVADDGEVKTYDDILLTVTEPTRVDVFASDSEAAELGPDTGEFTFTRAGDTNFDLTVFLALSGIASNGLDFAQLPTSLTFSNGADRIVWTVTPFLDHRTEGDQNLTITILTNAAYSVGNGEATVIIHDSPYGMWTISHFTLEELTEPAISGENADPDHDGLANLVEYASNLDPNVADAAGPLTAALEVDPADNELHLVVTYHRRMQPTDVAYAVYVSDDLVSWNTGTSYVQEIQATDDGNGVTETVKARATAPLSSAHTLYSTVRVWLLTTNP